MNRRLDWRSVTLLALVLAIGGFLRLNRLRAVPGWYPDEGSNIAIASSLVQGESAYLALGHSSFINGHPPLVYYVMALLFGWFGVDILWARLLTVTLGLLTLLLLFVVASRMCGRRVALLAALFYAVYPAAVVHSRFAFTYNQLAPLYLVALYGLWRSAGDGRDRWVVLAAGCTGAALLTDLAAASLLACLVLALLLVRPRALLWALPLALIPLLVWGAVMWRQAGAFFLQDVSFTLSRTRAPIPVQMARVVFYRTTLEGDLWLALGGGALLLQPGPRQRWLTAGMFGLSLLVVVRNGPAFGQSSYFLIPLYPLAAMGMGVLMDRCLFSLVPKLGSGYRSGLERFRLPPGLRLRLGVLLTGLTLSLLLVPLVSMAAEGIWLDYSLYLARFGDVLVDPVSAIEAAGYVNGHTAPDDVVLASPAIAWLVNARVADFQMAIAATGQATVHFPAHIPAERFRFDPRLDGAAYVILDPLWRGWAAAQMPQAAEMVRTVEAEWQPTAHFGDLQVYRHPLTGGED